MSGVTLCFGELLLRLAAPKGELLLQSPRLEAQFGGAEANVAVALARLGHPAAMVSVVPAGPLGDAAIVHLRRWGVDTRHVASGPGRMGQYFLTPGGAAQAASIIYDRVDSAFARIGSGAIDWPALLAGAAGLHVSGITVALGAGPAAAALKAVEAASAAGVPVSFDGNYRPSLWAGREGEAAALLRGIVAHARILFGDARDLRLLLGAEADDQDVMVQAWQAFPGLELIAGTRRTVRGPDRYELSARLDVRGGDSVTTPELDIQAIDRIGGGDAFAAGVLHALTERPGDLNHAAQTGLLLTAIKHGQSGDACLATRAMLEDARDGAGDVRR